MNNEKIKDIRPLDFLWEVNNPFLFCAHHKDHYPRGKEDMSPAASLEGRNIGQDFALKDGWRMYHGDTVPGFPEHPHRGFETVTVVLEGLVDHSDSWGQAGRYGAGDVQWMTAGSGLQHSEMFPLVNMDRDNPAELFQVWLNLPKEKKFVKPYYKMLWNENIPVYKIKDKNWKWVEVKVIAGKIGDIKALPPAPDSWAADADNHVAIWLIKMESGAQWILPPVPGGAKRRIYFYRGEQIIADGISVKSGNSFQADSNEDTVILNGEEQGFLFLLQGKPIDEPIVQYGPFVMNTEAEIRQAFADYRATGFGGWPWPRRDMVSPREKGRFAFYQDGREERP